MHTCLSNEGQGPVALVVDKAQRGMTLIEIMVVIVIIGVLGSTLAVGVFELFGEGREKTAKIQVQSIAAKVNYHQATQGDFPDSLADLKPKIKEADRLDPWKQELVYSTTGEGFSLCSNGPDRKTGTDDDICHDGEER
jgi:general secretion pathway protein G